MRKKRDRRKYWMGEEDKVLRVAVTAVIVLFAVGALIVVLRLLNPRVDASEGQKLLKELGQADVQTVDARIQELEKEERKAKREAEGISNNEIFAGTMTLGDSITQGLYQYGTLNESLVAATKGSAVCSPDKTGVTADLNKAIAAAPSKIFLAYGMNDMIGERGDAEAFKEDYRALVKKIKDALPDAAIYINSVLPVQQSAIAKNEYFAHIAEFNEALVALCEEEGAVFIDNTELVKEEYYAADGIHMSADYYPEWVEHMIEVAEL